MFKYKKILDKPLKWVYLNHRKEKKERKMISKTMIETLVRQAMCKAWEAIQANIIPGKIISREEVIGMVLEADRITMYGEFSNEEETVWKAMSREERVLLAREAFTCSHYGV